MKKLATILSIAILAVMLTACNDFKLTDEVSNDTEDTVDVVVKDTVAVVRDTVVTVDTLK